LIASGTKSLELKGIETPPPVFFCSIESHKSADEKNLNEALRLLQMEDPTFHFNTDPGLIFRSKK
jgi:translation elongation factor EF-G